MALSSGRAWHGFNSLAMLGQDLIVGAGSLYRMDHNGKLLWEVPSQEEWGFCRGEVVQLDSKLFATTQEGELFAFDAQTGKKVENIALPSRGRVWNALTLKDDRLLVSTDNRQLFCLKIH